MTNSRTVWYRKTKRKGYFKGELIDIIPTSGVIDSITYIVADMATGKATEADEIFFNVIGGKDLRSFHPDDRIASIEDLKSIDLTEFLVESIREQRQIPVIFIRKKDEEFAPYIYEEDEFFEEFAFHAEKDVIFKNGSFSFSGMNSGIQIEFRHLDVYDFFVKKEPGALVEKKSVENIARKKIESIARLAIELIEDKRATGSVDECSIIKDLHDSIIASGIISATE